MQGKQVGVVSDFDGLPDVALVDVKALAALTGSGVSTVWRRIKVDPSHPQPVAISARCTRFRVGDIRRWLVEKGAV